MKQAFVVTRPVRGLSTGGWYAGLRWRQDGSGPAEGVYGDSEDEALSNLALYVQNKYGTALPTERKTI